MHPEARATESEPLATTCLQDVTNSKSALRACIGSKTTTQSDNRTEGKQKFD
jgi:hypothetical protein